LGTPFNPSAQFIIHAKLLTTAMKYWV